MNPTTTMPTLAAAVAVTIMGLTLAEAQLPTPPAPPPSRLGDRGQTVITTELALDFEREVVEVEGEADVTSSTFDFHAGFDRVLRARLTLGVRVGFEGVLSGYDSRRRFDLGARFGALVPLGGGTTLWPTAGLTYGLTSLEDRTSSVTVRTVTLVLSAPILWQPVPRLLVGVGPTYHRDLQSKTGPDADQTGPSVSGFGIHGFLGLWFGGT